MHLSGRNKTRTDKENSPTSRREGALQKFLTFKW
jgi:hypothetical protein